MHNALTNFTFKPLTCYAVLFLASNFFFASCSENSNHKKTAVAVQDTLIPPVRHLIDDSKIASSDTFFAPQVIVIPDQGSVKTMLGTKGTLKKIYPPKITTLDSLLAQGKANFTSYSTENGLALDGVCCAFTDRNGNLWFGTFGGGISKYDGKAFTNYTVDHGLANNVVLSINQDRYGNLWFGTQGSGLVKFDGVTFSTLNTNNGLSNNIVISTFEDKIGNLWIGTYGGGVCKYDGNRIDAIERGDKRAQQYQDDLKRKNGKLVKSFTTYTKKDGLANNGVWCIKEDKIGNLWFGTNGGGISVFNGNRIDDLERGSKLYSAYQKDLLTKDGKFIKSFTNYNTSNGLVSNVVRCITIDKKGQFWFGTHRGGVSKFISNIADLKSKEKEPTICFQTFTTKHGLVNNDVYSIVEDNSGNLWMGGIGGGVSCYNGISFTNYNTSHGLPNNAVWCITKDKTGNLWFGTNGGGVCKYEGPAFLNYSTAHGLLQNYISSINQDRYGNIWFGTSASGVIKYDGKSFSNLNTQQGLTEFPVSSITEDRLGNLWFGSIGGGVFKYDGNRVEAIERGENIPANRQFDLKRENGKPVKTITNYSLQNGLAGNSVHCIKEDRYGNLWFGTMDGGLSKYEGNLIALHPEAQTLNKELNNNFNTKKGGLKNIFTNHTTAQGLINNWVWCIAEDQKGNLWFGTDAGLSKYDGNRIEAIEKGEKIPLSEQQDLQKKNGKFVKSFQNFTTAQGLSNNGILSILADLQGNLWFGTYGGGICRYAANTADNPKNEKQKLPDLFEKFTTLEGLPDNTVTQIIATKKQQIAIATNYGLGLLTHFNSKFETTRNPKSLGAVNNLSNAELKNYRPVFEIYNSSKGFPIKDVNVGQNSMFEDRNGILWIGTGNDNTALVRFDYSALMKNKQAPEVFLQNIKINKENVCWSSLASVEKDTTEEKANSWQQETMTYGKVLSTQERDSLKHQYSGVKFDGIFKWYPIPENLILPFEHNHITFDFGAIEPAKPYLVNYRYFLEGYDKEWSPILKSTNATYGNIAEGNYTFKVMAQSPFGIWSKAVEYKFRVLPPWYRTWWMYTLYGVTSIALLLGIIAFYVKRLRTRARKLSDEVRKATKTIIEQKKIVEEKHREITDSINYAERIQRSFLASKELLNQNLGEHFVFFQPKDVVSGDFYWASHLKDGSFCYATADCTGHGVPGAIMSILSISSLELSVKEKCTHPAEILNFTRSEIINRLSKDGSMEGGKDGMDASLIVLNKEKTKLTFSAANNPVWILRNATIIELSPDKMQVGKHDKDHISFTQKEFALQKGDLIYTFTDGFSDQFGGPKGKKFMHKQLKGVLLSMAHLSMKEQNQKLSETLNTWKGNLEQVDDILIIGVQVN